MDLAIISIIISCILGVITISSFVLNRKDKAVKDAKENNTPLIEYQLKELKDYYKEIANDVKEIRKGFENIKENIRDEIRIAMDEHIRQYHSKEK